MLFKSYKTQSELILKPFALKTKEGFLIGLTPDPEKASPCSGCVQRWLTERNVWVEPMLVCDLPPIAKKKLADLMIENSPHVLIEILENGNFNQLDSLVYPHPDCICNKKEYCAPATLQKNTNFAFSPIHQMKCVRYGTPGGNLWYFTAVGKSPILHRLVAASAAHPDKTQARLNAVDNWMKKAALRELEYRVKSGESIAGENFQTGDSTIVSRVSQIADNTYQGIGCGSNQEEALLNGLISLTKYQVLNEYAGMIKKPMLIVGSSSWLRSRVPFFLLQQYDLYLMFYPNSSPTWVVGLAAFSRLTTDEKPVFTFSADPNMEAALEKVIYQVLEQCRPGDWRNLIGEEEKKKKDHTSQLNLWWTNWIYKCPKISMKDVIQLEAHEKNIESWKNYFKDTNLNILNLNSDALPRGIRHLVKIDSSLHRANPDFSKVRGIGTWGHFSQAFSRP